MLAWRMKRQRILGMTWLWLLSLQFCWAGGKSEDSCRQQVEDQLDASKSACDSFYDFACGNWYVSYALRRFGAHDMRTQMRALNRQLLVRYFERPQQDEEHQQLVTFYGSCLGGRQTMRAYVDTMRQLPHQPQWPVLLANQSLTASPFEWTKASAGLRRFGAQGLWRLLVQANWQASEQQIFYMLPPTFDLLGGHRNDDQAEFLYLRYLKYLLLELGLKIRRAAAVAEQLVDFEKQLRDLVDNSGAGNGVDQSLVLREPQMLHQLMTHLPQLRLQEYFDTLLAVQAPGEMLIVADADYLKGLQRLLRSADPFVLSTWMLLQLPAHFEVHLHEDATLSQQREHCLEKINRLLPRQLARLQLALYYQETGQGERAEDAHSVTMQQVQQLFINLKTQFERLLNETTIFERDLNTQSRAREKLRAMRLILPWSDWSHSSTPGNQIGQLSSNYDENLLNLSKREALLQFREVLNCVHLPCHGSSSGSSSISAGPLDINAYYRLSVNAIVLPLGLLRSPLISSCAPIEAGLGYMLAHEMLHAFDYDGINYDADGSLASGQWPARAIIRFGLRAGCYLGSRYSNATLTINENIADSEGLRLAYETYRRRIKQQDQDQDQHQQLHQSDPSGDKMFFIKFAQNWCGNAATTTTSSIGGQQHASHPERVNNVLGNFPELAELFQCKAGSAMDPADKCRIW